MKPVKINIMFGITTVIVLGFFTATFSQSLSIDDITLYKDIIYTVVDGHELKLDIAVPKYLKSPVPAIVDIPGGAWRKVEKKSDDALFYTKHGFVGISITHRTSDIAVFLAAVHDCKTAIRWARANAEKYNINPDKIGITGVSSGRHLATLLGTSGGDKYLEGTGEYLEYSSTVQTVVNHFGPTDFLQGLEDVERMYKEHPLFGHFFDAIKDRLIFPEYLPAIHDFKIADGFVYTLTYQSDRLNSVGYKLDLDGNLVDKLKVPIKWKGATEIYPYTISNGYLYQLVENSESKWELLLIKL